MFETAELGRKLSKKEHEQAVPELRTELLRLQNELAATAPFSVVVVIAGVDGAGKGDTVNVLHEWMDPRYLEAHAFGAASDEEAERPPMWRFWRVLPPKGRIGIFFGSWYTKPILDRAYGATGDARLEAELTRINLFEKGLHDDGTLVVKYWFHLSKKAQKKRLKTLSKDPRQSWRVTEQDWKHFELYDTFIPICERAIRETSTGEAPWTIVEGSDRRYREVTVAGHLRDALADRLEHTPPSRRRRRPKRRTGNHKPTILSNLDLDQRLAPATYKRRVARSQADLNLLSRKAANRGTTMLAVFEGADAAGKGGAIRRITRALDARYYKVVPIAAPTDEEAARHYLWRFWRHLPRAGRMLIFDRSWYGRVLVERVEGFAGEDEWRRAYREINEFEEELVEFGVGVVKFWLHIDQDEQLARFKAREQTPYKQFKITEEDYRNRDKWELYEEAVNEMVERTSTSHAPWTLIEANDKYFARVKVLQTIAGALERQIKRDRKGKRRRNV